MLSTKQEIIHSSVSLIKKGYTVNDIIEETGITKNTFENYFRHEKDLFIAIFETLGDQYIEGFLEILWKENNMIYTLYALLNYDLKMLSSNYIFFQMHEKMSSEYTFEPELINKINQEYIHLFDQSKTKGFINEELNAEWVYVYYQSLIFQGQKSISEGEDFDEVREKTWKLLWKGIA